MVLGHFSVSEKALNEKEKHNKLNCAQGCFFEP